MNHKLLCRLILLGLVWGMGGVGIGECSAQGEASKSDAYGGFKVGLQSYTLRTMEIAPALEQSERLGLKYIEVYPRHMPLTTIPSQLADYRKQLSDRGITITGYGVVALDENESKTREIFDFAKAMGLYCIVANPKKSKETFDLLDKLVEEYQIPVAIHNHGPGSNFDKSDEVLEWIDGRNPLIGACVDTGHYMRSDEDPVEVAKKFGSRIYDVHLKDVRSILSDEEKERLYKELPKRRADQLRKEGKIFTILGEGELNVVGLLRVLRDLKYEKGVSLEYEENPDNPLSDVELCLSNLREAVAYLNDSEEGFVQLWDGKSLKGWTPSENKETWKIEEGTLLTSGPRSHLFYTGGHAPFKNFELKVDVLAEPNSNGGIYFHTEKQDAGWPSKGFEAQVNNTFNKDPRKTGSLYQVQDVHRQTVPDNTWWTEHLIVNGKHVIIKVDGKTVVDYTEPDNYEPPKNMTGRKLDQGTFALQAHDPESRVRYRNIRVKKLPD